MYNVVDRGYTPSYTPRDTKLMDYYKRMIQNELFKCSVPDLLTRTDENLRSWGVAVTGDRNVDASNTTSRVEPMVTIETIKYWIECGIDVIFENPADIAVMYGYIGGYLEEWAKTGSGGVNHYQDGDVEWASSLMDFFRDTYSAVSESIVYSEDHEPEVNIGLVPIMHQVRAQKEARSYSKDEFRDRYKHIEESIDRRTRR